MTTALSYGAACAQAACLAVVAQTAPPLTSAASTSSSAWVAAGLILLVVGIAIAVLEMFIPSGGVLAIAAATALVGSVACFFAYDTMWGFGALVLYLAGSPIAILLGIKLWSHTPLAKGMVLGSAEDDDDENLASRPAPQGEATRVGVGAPGSREPVAALLGRSGVAVTTMRPVGFVRLGSERIEAHAESGMIEAGTKITVIDCEGARVVVRPIAE